MSTVALGGDRSPHRHSPGKSSLVPTHEAQGFDFVLGQAWAQLPKIEAALDRRDRQAAGAAATAAQRFLELARAHVGAADGVDRLRLLDHALARLLAEAHDSDPEKTHLGTESALDSGVRDAAERHLGPLGDVRIHQGEVAERATASAGARALTVGRDVYLNAGESPTDLLLMGHELTHVAQQADAVPTAQAKLEIGGDDSPAEEEADRTAHAIASGATPVTNGPVQRSPVQYGARKAKAVQTIDPNLPAPATMTSAGDWFHLEWRPNPDRVAIRYDGGYGLRGQTVTNNQFEVSVPDPKRTAAGRPYQPRVLAQEGRVVYDLFGDNSYRLEIRDQPNVSPISFDEREHVFTVSLNGKRHNDHRVFVSLPKAGEKPPVSPVSLAREQTVATTVRLLGDELQIQARRFGDTDQVQLHFIGPKTANNIPTDTLVKLAKPPTTLALKVIAATGRDLHLDLDGDGKADAFFVHTAFAEDQGKLQDRTHILRQFDRDGVFIGREHVFAALGPPVAIPDDQSEKKSKPDLNKEVPLARPTQLDDVPGEVPDPVGGPGGVREIRIDGDGDRHKELLLRLKAGNPGADRRLPVTMHVTMVATGEVHDLSFSLPDASPGMVWPMITRVGDGYTPTEITFGNKHKMSVKSTHAPGATVWGYAINVAGTSLAAKFTAPKGGAAKLVTATEKAVKQGDLAYVDAVLGEYGDKFRFFVDRNPSRTTFGVRPVIGNDPLGGREVEVEKWVSSVALLKGDPNAVTLDLNGDGKADAVIYDRLTVPSGADPRARRTHSLTFTGAAFPHGATRTFEVEGQLKEQTGFVPSLQAQGDQGDTGALMTRLDGARHAAIRKCHDEGLLADGVYKAWTTMALAMARLPLSKEERARRRQTDVTVRGAAAAAFKRFHEALTGATKGAPGADDSQGKLKRVNRYTVTTTFPRNDNRQEGAGVQLGAEIASEQWDTVARMYEQVNDGFDKWIQHLLVDKHGKDSQEAQSHKYVVALENRIQEELDDKKALRIPAVFTPDEKPEEFAQLVLFAYHEDDTWYLKDLTNPSETPFTDKEPSKDNLPPAKLFEKLNHFKHFPKGTIHYRIPGGADGRVKTTSDKPWHWYLSWVGLGVVAIGAGLMTFGTGTVATLGAVAVAGGSFAGAAAAAGNLIDDHEHGRLTAGTVVLDLAQIVGGLAGGTSVLGGRLIKVAAEADAAVSAGTAGSARLAGNWARLAGLAQRTYLPINVVGAGADTVTLLIMTDEVAKAIHAIVSDDKVGKADKAAALARVLGQFLAVGAITAMSIKGTVADVFTAKPAIEIVNVHGRPVVVRAGTKPDVGAPIGKPPVVGAEGSITPAGKERIAGLHADFRKKLLQLEQRAMGKFLTQSNAILDNLASLTADELRKLGRMSERAIAKMSTFDDTSLRGFLDVDVSLVDNLATNLDALAFRDAMRLPVPARTKLATLGSKSQQGLIKAKREHVVTLLDDAPDVVAHLPFEHRDALEKLAGLGRDARARLVGKLGARRQATVLWQLDVTTLERIVGMLDGELDVLATLGANGLKKLAPLHAQHLRNLASLTPAELAEVAKLDLVRIRKLSAHGDMIKARPFSQAAVDRHLANLSSTEAHVGAELTRIRPHLSESDPFVRGGGLHDTTNSRIKVSVAGKGKPMSVMASDIVVLEPVPGGAINRIEVTGHLAEGKGNPIATGELQQIGGRWEVPRPGTPDTTVTVETGSGRHPYTDVQTPPPGTRVWVSPKEIVQRGFAGGHTRTSWQTTATTYGDLIASSTETQVGFMLPTSTAEIRITKIDYKVLQGGVAKKVKYPKTVFEKPDHMDLLAAHAKPYIAAAWEANTPKAGVDDVLIVDVPIKTSAGSDAVLKLSVPRSGRTTMAKPTDADMSTWWAHEDNFVKGGKLNP